MSDLLAVARGRSEVALNSQLVDLPQSVKALQQSLAAKGTLKSGNMLRGVLAIAKEALNAHAATLSENYAWAVTESLAATGSWVRRLSQEAADSLQPLYALGVDQIVAACRMAETPNLSERLVADLKATHLETRRTIELTLDAAFATKSRGILRRLTSVVGRIVPGLGGK